MAHRHQSNVEIAASHLKTEGHISAMTTIYSGECECGETKRNTRLAGTIHTLRHEYGWDIRTDQKPGMLADYVLVTTGRGVGTVVPLRRPSANSSQTVAADDVPNADIYFCPHCGGEVRNLDAPLLGGYRLGRCSHCDGTVKAMPWKPTELVENIPTRVHQSRQTKARRGA